ncbi:class I SAM-dependent methyltransferase [Pendulispora brunnea]|uniref:Class I SAM-dependent methyltransferase n=1 Tax=Pendulispora brunnea TaxID=2905690 RepID=A0ABZ2KKM9_9BACT
MDPKLQKLLASYEERAAAESHVLRGLSSQELEERIDEFLIPVGPDTGQLLHTLVKSSKAQCVVEIGASYGYSSLWLADAVRLTGGKVHSFELSSAKVEHAQEKLRSVGLDGYVEFHVGDVFDNLPSLAGPLDLVLIDCWKDLYERCFEMVHPKLAEEGIVVADNMLFPSESRPDAVKYQKLVRSKNDMDAVALPIGSGIDVARRRTAPSKRALT